MITLSWGSLAALIRRADVVVETVDARVPLNTRSRRLERLVETMGKPVIIALNKADLVPREVAEEWTRIFRGEGYEAVYLAAREHKGTRVLRKKINRATDVRPVVVAVVGYPKTGKSTVINALRGRAGASTSPVPGSPGFTKRPGLYRGPGQIYFLDTPGVIPPDGNPLEKTLRGAPPEKLKDPVGVAAELYKFIKKYNPEAFEEAYGFDTGEPYSFLEELARRRGWFYKSDHEPLVEEAAKALLYDYHKGKIPFYVPPGEYWR
ncbi:GTPase [Ignicoccus hospitalis]|uniref:Ras superfamily GTP-binding protein YlqF n=1 Tax=Ignicoccus hospitalis (strain KIN4/I / DSM 18386 / JCM 14125) TaxID=453591 RepID=A8A8U9_IGNH4|nr:GTPase [Ignicoccus hospitalis]ABU81351.1 Ras superfamily GTP-binding protein YlqF [Ignicoccus hospitalis KIN4/I]HIH90345.1 GTPase RsgA [Desulfurococcaceae archaeon]